MITHLITLLSLFTLLLTSSTESRIRSNEKSTLFPDSEQLAAPLRFSFSDATESGGSEDLTSVVDEDFSQVHFYLLTRSNNSDEALTHEELFEDDMETLQNSSFLKNVPLKLLAHGYLGSFIDDFPQTAARAYVRQEQDLNVIVMDYGELVPGPSFENAVENGKMISKRGAAFLQFLVDSSYITLDKVHLIGWSLGAHVVGNIGGLLGGKVARVTGLDPALPIFDKLPDSERLDPTDAQFVDVIHTSGGYWYQGGSGIGFLDPRGHADFYPNNGKKQPGCELEIIGTCSHPRAPRYFEESIISEKGFFACPCESWRKFRRGDCNCEEPVLAGEGTPLTANGTYYYRTRSRTPFAMGKDGARNR